VQLARSGNSSDIYYGKSKTYYASDMCEKTRLWQDPGYTHTVMVTHLSPGVKYTLKYGNQKSNGSVTWAKQDAVVMLPALPGSVTPTEILIVADMGNSRAYCDKCTPDLIDDVDYQNQAGAYAAGASAVVASMQRQLSDVSFIAHIGDLSYACGVDTKWDYWMDTIKPLISKVPYMVSVGNHEYDYWHGARKDPSGAVSPYIPNGLVYDDDSLGECGVPTSARFSMPETGNSVFWYSFESGLAHFVMISLEHNISATSPQGLWLQKDLESVDRSNTPWVLPPSLLAARP
jgi:hypothetical protein